MPNLMISGSDTFTYLDVYQEDRTEGYESTFSYAQWCPKIRNKPNLYQDPGISEQKRTLLLAHLKKYVAWALYSKDLTKALENIEAISKYWRAFHTFVFAEEEKSVSTLKDIIDIEIEPSERKRITWDQAHMLAFTSLIDAEERRRHFAEKEAKLTTVWEEWD